MKHIFKNLLFTAVALVAVALVACSTDEGKDKEPTPPEDNTPKLPTNYFKYGDDVVELGSMLYTVYYTEEHGNQYFMAMTPAEGFETLDAMFECEDLVMLSFGEDDVAAAIEGDGTIDVMTLSEDDNLYSLSAYVGALELEDFAADHTAISEGKVTLAVDVESFAMELAAHYVTAEGVDVDIVATLPYVETVVPDDKVDVESTLSYKWGDMTLNKELCSAFLETTPEGVVYTLCVDVAKTYYTYEDSIFLRFAAKNKSADDNFEMDLATTTESFSLRLCDPIRGLDYSADNANREGLTGSFKVEDGVVTVAFTSAEVEATALYGGKYRSVNECIDVVDNGRELLFTPASVLMDNRDAETFKLYVSSKVGVTTVEAMADAEVVITYPAAGWAMLSTGNFVSGSAYAMTFTIGGTTHVKGEGDTVGMNCQLIGYNGESDTLTLNANLYTKQGGVAIYYVGGYTIVE